MTDPYTQRPKEPAGAVGRRDGRHGRPARRSRGGHVPRHDSTVVRLTIPKGPAVGGEESR